MSALPFIPTSSSMTSMPSSPQSSVSSTPSTSAYTSPASSSTHLARPPILKPLLTSSPSSSSSSSSSSIPRGVGRLGPKCTPSQGGGGQLNKYRQPPSTLIPYPRGEVNIMECIEHRRGIKVLGKMEGYVDETSPNGDRWEGAEPGTVGQQVVVVRHKTVGGQCKRVWEKVAFWDRAKNGRREREMEYGEYEEGEDEWN